MNRRGRIRLSTMEIVLIGVLVASLALGLIQARQLELLTRDGREAASEHQ